jgi:hypothetical protein
LRIALQWQRLQRLSEEDEGRGLGQIWLHWRRSKQAQESWAAPEGRGCGDSQRRDHHRPDDGFRLLFLSFIYRWLSLPAHEFFRGLLFVYGVQLHQLTPNSILHIACFITLCEAFLGVDPPWGLWKRIFCLRRNVSKEQVHDVGGAIIPVHPEAKYFKFNMADSVQGWRIKWFCIKDQKSPEEQQYGLAPFDPTKEVKKLKSWDQLPTEAGLEESEPLMT